MLIASARPCFLPEDLHDASGYPIDDNHEGLRQRSGLRSVDLGSRRHRADRCRDLIANRTVSRALRGGRPNGREIGLLLCTDGVAQQHGSRRRQPERETAEIHGTHSRSTEAGVERTGLNCFSLKSARWRPHRLKTITLPLSLRRWSPASPDGLAALGRGQGGRPDHAHRQSQEDGEGDAS
jgi:hypothetical protein